MVLTTESSLASSQVALMLRMHSMDWWFLKLEAFDIASVTARRSVFCCLKLKYRSIRVQDTVKIKGFRLGEIQAAFLPAD